MHECSIERQKREKFLQAAGIGPAKSRAQAAWVPGPSPEISEIGQLVARLRPQLEAAALRVTREPEAASDVVQQATLKAIRFRHQFRGTAALSTWIYRIVVNEALMWRRGQRRRALALEKLEKEMPLHVAGTLSPDELVDERRRLAAVARGFRQLSEGDRKVLGELFTHAPSSRELTLRLGIPSTAIRTRIFRARRRLRKLVETA